jgi:hypothetical protein
MFAQAGLPLLLELVRVKHEGRANEFEAVARYL